MSATRGTMYTSTVTNVSGLVNRQCICIALAPQAVCHLCRQCTGSAGSAQLCRQGVSRHL
eukprot:1161186-Pelagomonas_calceolata.AAC.5